MTSTNGSRTATFTQPRMCAFHTDNGAAAAHPHAGDCVRRMIAAKQCADAEDQYLYWEATYDQFMGCDVCTHEQLILLSDVAAGLKAT